MVKQVIAIVIVAWCAGVFGANHVSYSFIPKLEQQETLGATPCNHQEKVEWCTPGTVSCGGECDHNLIFTQCTGHQAQVQSTSGTIFVCASTGAESPLNCEDSDGEFQTCVRTTECKCLAHQITGVARCIKRNVSATGENVRPVIEGHCDD